MKQSSGKHLPRYSHLHFRERLIIAIAEFEGKTFEREELIRLMFLTIFCKQHMFLFGKPGTGKTMIARLATMLFGDGNFWEILMSYDTKTEQLMGGVVKDENGKVTRALEDSMLNKPFVFLDEMFKANNKVLNALLGPMLDRKYSEGNIIHEVPLITLFGASNEFPQGEDIKPFEDRIMFRFNVPRLQSTKNRIEYLRNNFDRSPTFSETFEIDEIDFIGEEISKIIFDDDMLAFYIKLQDTIIDKGVLISDRKFGPDQAGKVFRVSAYMNGRDYIDHSDIMLLKHIAWHNLIDKEKLEKVLEIEFFGDKVEIGSRLIGVSESYERATGIFNSNHGATVSYQEEYSGDKGIQRLNSKLNDMKIELNNLININTTTKMIMDRVMFAEGIVKMCEENIFLYNIEQKVFTRDIVEKVQAILDGSKADIDFIDSWIKRNPTLFDYQNNQAERRRSTMQ